MRKAHALGATRFCRWAAYLFAILLVVPAFAPAALAQDLAGAAQPLITQPINESSLVVLSGNTRPEAQNPANDRGAVPDGFQIPHMMLQLRRPAAREQALETLIDQLHDTQSPNFHHWLSAAEIGAQFGPASSDVATITNWLQQHGFTVNTVYPSGMVIDYSGTAEEVRAAFHTDIHYLNVNGVTRFANTADPEIPVALTPAVVGIVALHNIPPQKMFVPRSQYTPTGFVCGPTGHQCYLLAPADLATIYNFNPVFTGGTSGQGQTIYLLEDTDLYSTTDWTTFRSTLGLSGFTGGSLTTVHPGCSDPGVNGDDDEAILDAEWASAAAPSAAIVMAACSNILSAIQSLISSANPPAIMSISYGSCEPANGAATNAAFNSAYQQGAAEGASIFVAAGDSDADTCDRNNLGETTEAQHGISASGWASTPYNVAVGGTDFSDTYSGTNSTYWNSTNGATFGSAKSYIPEIPWNQSCGSQLIAHYISGSSLTYGSSGFCNSAAASNDGFLSIIGGSGGPSGCATGSPSVAYEVSGTCAGWPKPSWQAGLLGNPTDSVRDTPDVSLFAASGVWTHYYVFCLSDPNNGGNGCSGAPVSWNGGGGTSFSSPIWAGIQALIDQKAGGAQGLPNYRYYQLAAKEYGTSGSSACNSSNGNTVSSSCVFYDVTLGDNDIDCSSGSPNCYDPSGTYGVLSTSTSAYAPAYATTTGWDFPTGIGTVNVANLVNGWVGGGIPLTDTHDFNGDTKSDILWRDTSNDIAVWLLDSNVVAQSAALGNIGSNFSIIGQHDFTGTGRADILWRDGSGNLSMWFMKGAAVASAAAVGNVTSNFSLFGTGDLNGDGKGDLLWRDANTGTVSVWFMNGAAVASTKSFGAIPSNWTILGDANGGILWRDSSGDIALWAVQGATITSSTGLGTVPSNFVVQGVGDFNGDGYIDILWRDTNTGTLSIWYTNGKQVTSASVVSTLPSNWSVAQIGDYNGDGYSDILLLDSSGDLAVWLMNGSTVSSSVGISNVGTTWQVQSLNDN
jgi:hypothetical protein